VGNTCTTNQNDQRTGRNRNRREIIHIDPIEPIRTEEIDGKYLCGVLGGSPFKDLPRPTAGECPAGTMACPGAAS